MHRVRRSSERGLTTTDWLESRHSFSFDRYHDPKHMGFRALRVINEDVVAPGAGFGMHPHRDMEIVTWVIAGELAHRDSLGNGAVVRPGEIQRMTAGTGVVHAETNPSRSERVHLLQIWLLPEERGLAPGYEQRAFAPAELDGKLRLLASRDARDGSVMIHQDIELHAARLSPPRAIEFELRPGRHAWLQVVAGEVEVAGARLRVGDGLCASDERRLVIEPTERAELLLFDLA
jgi:redox-sensitive bicupin YhaK (pirin superfamily)